MKIVRFVKVVRRSKVLTKQEKKDIIRKAMIEGVLNSYKGLCKLPFAIVGVTFCLLGMLFAKLEELMELLETPFSCITQKIEDWDEIVLTKGETRNKLLNEIKGNTFKIKVEDNNIGNYEKAKAFAEKEREQIK